MPGKAFKGNNSSWRRGQSVGSPSSSSSSRAEHGGAGASASASAVATVAVVSAHDQKRAKKQADASVAEGVAIQEKLDNSENASPAEKLAALDAAIARYDHALRLSPRHADASYNWAVASIEKLEIAPHVSPDGTLLRRCIDLLEGVIAADTSRRGETAGLSHRAVANAMLEHFELVMRLKGVSDKQLLDIIKGHFEEALRILASFGDLGSYYVEYCRYYRLYLDRVLLDASLAPATKVEIGKQLSTEFNALINKVLQSGSTGDADVDIIIERSSVLAEFVLAALDLSSRTGGTAAALLPGLDTLVQSLHESAETLVALAPDEEEAYDAARENLEVLIRFFQFTGDGQNFITYCNRLLCLCENSSKLFHSASYLADLGGSLFAVASTLSRFPVVLDLLVNVSSNAPVPGAPEAAITACQDLLGTFSRAATSIDQRVVLPDGFRVPALQLTHGSAHAFPILHEILRLAYTVYRACVFITESRPQGEGFSSDDMNVVCYNMACIGWRVGDEDACRMMLAEYVAREASEGGVASSGGSSSVGGVAERIVAIKREAVSDDDLAGVDARTWFVDIGL